MKAPQVIFIVLTCIELFIVAALHNTPRTNYNIFWKLLDAGVLVGLLIWGGFFS